MIRNTREDSDDRRLHPRYEAGAPVTVRNAERRFISGKLVNLSAGGALLRLDYNDDHFDVGDTLDLLINGECGVTAFARFQTLSASVCRADSEQLALRFDRIRHELDPEHAPVIEVSK